MALLTAVMQITARQTGAPLDEMTTETHITTMSKPDEVTYYPENGAFVHGLFIEVRAHAGGDLGDEGTVRRACVLAQGARWATKDESEEPRSVGGVPTQGHLVDARLKSLLPPLPVVYVRAVPVQSTWDPTEVRCAPRAVPDSDRVSRGRWGTFVRIRAYTTAQCTLQRSVARRMSCWRRCTREKQWRSGSSRASRLSCRPIEGTALAALARGTCMHTSVLAVGGAMWLTINARALATTTNSEHAAPP